nr:ABC transporter substrate-binding protein [Variovorax boronicumulans]
MKLTSLSRLRTAALLTLATLAGAAGGQQPTKLRFALDWVFQGPQAPFLVPHQNGCYQKAGLDVTTDRGFGSGDTVVKVGAGTYDVGFADINAMVEYNAKQTRPEDRLIAFFMVYDGAALSIITRKDTGVAKPADLVGKTIAAPPGDASRRLFPALAQANGFDASAVKWMNVAPELRETMLARKQADAISGAAFTGYMGARAVGVPKDELVVMRFPQFGSTLYGSALVAKRAFAASHGPALTALAQCVAEGIVTSIRQPASAIEALYQRDKLINREVEQERLQLSLDWSIVTPWTRANGLGGVDPVRLGKSMQEVASALNIAAPDTAEVFTAQYLPPAERRAVPK